MTFGQSALISVDLWPRGISPLARAGFCCMLNGMFEKIKDQLPAAADKVAHLRRFL
jgi:hypothetical protein